MEQNLMRTIAAMRVYKRAALTVTLFIVNASAIACSLLLVITELFVRTEWTLGLVPLAVADLITLFALPMQHRQYPPARAWFLGIEKATNSLVRLINEVCLTIYVVSPSFQVLPCALLLFLPILLTPVSLVLIRDRVDFITNASRVFSQLCVAGTVLWVALKLDGIVEVSWNQLLAPFAIISSASIIVPLGCFTLIPFGKMPARHKGVSMWASYVLFSFIGSVLLLSYKATIAFEFIHYSLTAVFVNCVVIGLSAFLLRTRLIYWLMGFGENLGKFKVEDVSLQLVRRSATFYEVSRPVDSEGEALAVDPLCTICCELPCKLVFMGCGHGGLCYSCALRIYMNDKKCHICKKVIPGIYLVEEDRVGVMATKTINRV